MGIKEIERVILIGKCNDIRQRKPKNPIFVVLRVQRTIKSRYVLSSFAESNRHCLRRVDVEFEVISEFRRYGFCRFACCKHTDTVIATVSNGFGNIGVLHTIGSIGICLSLGFRCFSFHVTKIYNVIKSLIMM